MGGSADQALQSRRRNSQERTCCAQYPSAAGKTQDDTTDKHRNDTVIYPVTRQKTAKTYLEKNAQRGYINKKKDLPLSTNVAGMKPEVAPPPAPSRAGFKRVFATARREGLAHTYSALGRKHKAFVKAQSPTRNPTNQNRKTWKL